MHLLPGNIVDGKFRVLSKLGSGGMGAVYLAEQLDFERNVALKVLSTHEMDDEESYARFLREANIIGSLRHRNIVSVYSFGKIANTPYIAMEYLAGDSLQSLLRSGNPLPAEQSLQIAEQICAALIHAHKSGVVHRDLKPANVIVMPSGNVKVIDFGLAKSIFSAEGQQQQQLTRDGTALGSALYMSPEQCLGQPADGRSDLYGLACVLYHCIAGRPPFNGDSTVAVMYKQLNDEAPPLVSASGIGEIGKFFEKALRKDPEQRYQSAESMLLDLQLLRQSGTMAVVINSESEQTPSPKRGSRLLLKVSALATLFVTGALLVVLADSSRGLHDSDVPTSDNTSLQAFTTAFGSKHSGLEKLEFLSTNVRRLALTQAQESDLMKQSVNVVIAQAHESRKSGDPRRGVNMLVQAMSVLDRFHHNAVQRFQLLRCAAFALEMEASLQPSERNQQLKKTLWPIMVPADHVSAEELDLLFEIAQRFYYMGDHDSASVVYERATPTLLNSNPSVLDANRYVLYAIAIASNGVFRGENNSAVRVLPAAERFMQKVHTPDTLYQMAMWELDISPPKSQAFAQRMLTQLPITDENLAWRGRAILAETNLRQGKVRESEREEATVVSAIRKSSLSSKVSQEAAVFVLDRLLIGKWSAGKGAEIPKLLPLYPPAMTNDQRLYREALLAYGYQAQGRCDEALQVVLHAAKEADSLKLLPGIAAEIYICAGAVCTACGDKQSGLDWWQKARAIARPRRLQFVEHRIESAQRFLSKTAK